MLATAQIYRHIRSRGSRLLLAAPFLRQAPPSPRRSLSTPAAQAAPQKSLGAFPTEITTLPNGVRVASQDAPGHFVTVGAYVDVGSRYETDETAGFCHMLDRLSYKGTKSFTRDQLLSEIEALGGNFFSQTSREATIYQAAVFRKDLPKAVHLLSEVVTEPVISAEEVEAAKETIQYELLDMQWRLDSSLQEKLQRLAFGGLGRLGDQAHLITAKKDDACATSTLDRELDAIRGVAGVGRSMICTDASLATTSAEAVRAFRSLWYTPDRIVVAGVGMPHQELVDLARASFGALPPATSEVLRQQAALSVPSSYTGGIVLVDTANGPTSPFPDDQNLTHVFIAFEAPSLLDPDVYALATLSTLMGGGGSFSAGGPGKGMYTRLYTQVLNQYHWVERCNMVSFSFLDTGLFGIYAAVPPSRETHEYIVPVLCHHLYEMTQKITPEELSRAKNQLKSNLLMSLESRSVELEDIGRQVMVRPIPALAEGHPPFPASHRVDVAEMCRRVDSLTAEDLLRVARRVVLGDDTASPLEFEQQGDPLHGHPLRHWHRTGAPRPTVLVLGARTGPKDDLWNVRETLRKWRLDGGELAAAASSQGSSKWGVFSGWRS